MEDDIDIYGDLDNIKDEEPKIDPELVKELQEKNAELESKVEELTNEFDKLRKYCDSLEANISSLHKTARVEIERKDRMISDLRQQVDNAAFRRDNFRIPKRINKPVKFPPPPKEDSYYPETVKKEVNNTINREETTYASPLNAEPEDTEQIYQPDKVPVTLFGERLRARLQRELEEEAAAKSLAEQNPPPAGSESKKPEDLDKENQYRLIPLTLKTSSEDSRKRASENSEQEPKQPEVNQRRERETSSNHNNKRRKLEENHQSRREKSPNHRQKSQRRSEERKRSEERRRSEERKKSEERRRLEHEEYCCPTKSTNDRHNTRSRANGSSRSRSRDRRERRDERESHSDRRKNGRTSRSPNRRREPAKFGKNDRKVVEERGKLRSSKRLRGRDVSPCDRMDKMDLRKRLGGRNDNVVQRRVNERRETRTSRSDRRERIEDIKDKEDKEDRMSRKEAERSEDGERRKRSRETSSEKRSAKDAKEENQRVEAVHENTMDVLDCLEEGEIADSPGALIFIPNYNDDDDDKSGKTNHIKSSVNNKVEGKNTLNDNLDDSIKEEKIENIEKFIMKMQKDDENGIATVREGDAKVDGKVEALDEEKTIMVNNEPVAYNSVLSKYVKKKRDSTDKILDAVEINNENLVKDSVDKISDCTAKNEAPEIANNNVTKNNVNTGNKIDNNDSEVKTEIVRAPETLDKIRDESKINLKNSGKIVGEKDDLLKFGDVKGNDELEEKDEKNDELEEKAEKNGEMEEKDGKNDELEINGEVRTAAEKLEKNPKSPRKEVAKEVSEASKNLQKLEALLPSRVILQQIASPTKTQPKLVDNPQKLEPKEKENSVKSSTAQPNRIIVVARRRKVKLTDSSTSMTVVMSAKNSIVKN